MIQIRFDYKKKQKNKKQIWFQNLTTTRCNSI